MESSPTGSGKKQDLTLSSFTGKDLARSAAVYERALQEGHFRNEAEEREVNYYLGYVEGAALASPRLCLPPARGMRNQLGAVTASYLRLHPREWHLAPDAVVLKAVLPLFGCSKSPAPKAHTGLTGPRASSPITIARSVPRRKRNRSSTTQVVRWSARSPKIRAIRG